MRALLLVAAALLPLGACKKPQAAQPPPPTTAFPPAKAPGGEVNPPVQVLTYDCADGRVIEAGYPTQDTAVIKTPEHSFNLAIVPSGSGARYVGYGLQWWTKGMSEARLSKLKDGEDIASDPGVACKARGSETPVEPPAPGTPGGLPDDRTPVSEAPFTPTSAQGAATVAQTYYALIGEKKYAEAWKLWFDAGRASAVTQDQFVKSFSAYRAYNAQVGGPSEIEGAAGSLYVEVPVVIYGRWANGRELHQSGKATLRRVNDVPGSSAEQRQWRIAGIDLK
jgi:membrane-bound inhibitor of C-type lysozyme